MATTLFPPVVPVNQPTQILSSTFNLFFNTSSFNNLKDIAAIQISIKNMNGSNILAAKGKQESSGKEVSTTSAPYGIHQIETNNIMSSSNMYYVSLAKELITDIKINTVYKIQFRFVSSGIEKTVASVDIQFPSWISENQSSFSEWSEVSLIEFTSLPQLTSSLNPQSRILDLSVDIKYTNTSDEIEKYRFKLGSLDWEDWQIAEDKEKITYRFKDELENNKEYKIYIQYITHKGYHYQPTNPLADFTTKFINYDLPEDVSLSVTAEEDLGRIMIKIGNLTKMTYTKGGESKSYLNSQGLLHLQVLRTSSESAYSKWETIRDCSLLVQQSEGYDFFAWADTTISASVWYKYGFIFISPDGDESVLYNGGEPILCYFEDIFLDNISDSLKIRFDPDITNMKYVVNEQVTNTLGNQYPVVYRSGDTKYRQFTINGTISSDSNTIEVRNAIPLSSVLGHSNKETVASSTFYNNFYSEDIIKAKVGEQNYESQYIKKHTIRNNVNNYIYEKEFRDKVTDLLYKNDVKLFRSLTEGNILVKLTGVTLTPNKTLSRMIYTFSATATEVAADTVENYNKYNILNSNEIKGHYEYVLKIADKAIRFADGKMIPNYTANSVLTKEVETTDQLKLYLIWVEDK